MAADQPYVQQGAVPQATQPSPQQPQGIIITQPTPGVRVNAYQTYKAKSALRLGSLQIVLGSLSLIMAIVHIVVNSPMPGRQFPYIYGYSNSTYLFGTGIWCGVLVSFLAGRRKKII